MNISMLFKRLVKVGILLSMLIIQSLISPVNIAASDNMNPFSEDFLQALRQNYFLLSSKGDRNDFAFKSKPSHMSFKELINNSFTSSDFPFSAINTNQASGSISVNSVPDGADIYLDNNQTGKRTPAVLTGINQGKHTIVIRKDSYADAFQSVDVVDGNLVSVNLFLQQGYQNIEISTEKGGRIFLNDTEVGSESFIGRLSYGSHNIRIEKESFRTRDTIIAIVRGHETRLPYFKLDYSLRRIIVNTEPTGAEVFINGTRQGITPATINNLPEGNIMLTLVKEGFRSFSKDLVVGHDETININEILTKAGVELYFKNKPEGAEVFIDGELIGISPVRKITTPGQHKILVRKDLYEDYESVIDVQSDFIIDIELNRQKELIRFSSYPKKAIIILDGESYSLPLPTPGIYLETGRHNLILQKKNFRSVEKEITVTSKSENMEFLLYPNKFRSKATSVLLSILWPGAGQSYLNRAVTPHMLMGFAGYGFATMSYFKYDKTMDLQLEYYSETIDPDRRSQLKEQGLKTERQWKQLAYAAGSIWGVNLIWSIISPSEQNKYEKLKLKFNYDENTRTPLLGFVKNF